MKKRKIAIVGGAPSSCHLAPYDDETWEIWGLNFGWRWMSRLDRLYEMHDTDYLMSDQVEHWQWLKDQDGKKPIIMQDVFPEVAGSVKYPLVEIMDKYASKYFTNSISYMIAQACYEGCDELGLWGVDMAQSHQPDERNEYACQRPSCEFFTGVAVGLGIKLFVAPESDLLKCRHLYGYKISTGDMGIKMKARSHELQGHIDRLTNELDNAAQQLQDFVKQREIQRAAYVGALNEQRYQKQWIPEDDKRQDD